jgi:hypothetical protein
MRGEEMEEESNSRRSPAAGGSTQRNDAFIQITINKILAVMNELIKIGSRRMCEAENKLTNMDEEGTGICPPNVQQQIFLDWKKTMRNMRRREWRDICINSIVRYI